MTPKVLIVEDEPCASRMMELVLRGSGFDVVTASSIASAEAAIRQHPELSLAVIDYYLDSATGANLTKHLLADRPGIKVLSISGAGGPEAALESMRAGASDFLRKPFTAACLRRSAKRLMEGGEKYEPLDIVCREFSRQDIPGFSFEITSDITEDEFGVLTCTFEIIKDDQEPRFVKIVIPAFFQELVLAHIDADEVPFGNRFFQALAENRLADYLTTHRAVPEPATMVLDDITQTDDAWIESVMTVSLDQED